MKRDRIHKKDFNPSHWQMLAAGTLVIGAVHVILLSMGYPSDGLVRQAWPDGIFLFVVSGGAFLLISLSPLRRVDNDFAMALGVALSAVMGSSLAARLLTLWIR